MQVSNQDNLNDCETCLNCSTTITSERIVALPISVKAARSSGTNAEKSKPAVFVQIDLKIGTWNPSNFSAGV